MVGINICGSISIKQLTSTPYHPICNGLVEKWNGTLKTIVKRSCAEQPKLWDRNLPAVLFANHEAKQESLQFNRARAEADSERIVGQEWGAA